MSENKDTSEYELRRDLFRGRTENELIADAAGFVKQLNRFDEGQLLGVVGMLSAAALVVLALLMARQGLKAVRGETHPSLKGSYTYRD